MEQMKQFNANLYVQSNQDRNPQYFGILRCNKLGLVYSSSVKLLVSCSSYDVHFMDLSILKGEKEHCSEISEISLETSV